MYLRREPRTTAQRPETSNRLVLTDEIKVNGVNLSSQNIDSSLQSIVDYRVWLIILSPKLARYRSLDKGLKTGPGAIVMVRPTIFVNRLQLKRLYVEEWLHEKSGIDQRYFKDEVYQELRVKVKSSCRYARNGLKDVVRDFALRFATHRRRPIDPSFRRRKPPYNRPSQRTHTESRKMVQR